MPKVYFETYGCSNSRAEAEIMAGLLYEKDYSITDKVEDTDVIIINTCVVKNPTQQKIEYRIQEFQKMYPAKKLIVTGCMPEVYKDKIEELAPNASILGTHSIDKIVPVVEKIIQGKRVVITGENEVIKICRPKVRINPVVNIVPISSGCNGSCTYCATRFAKGLLYSYPKNKILEEISSGVRDGCKEVWLTSQDTGAYGLDKFKSSQLPDLLNSISKLEGDFSVRVGMTNPNNIKPILTELVEAYNSKKIYKFLHLPIQSGDDDILRSMNRFYTVSDFENIIQGFREAYKMNIWTDIIVGYPGETEAQFKNTLKFIKKIKPDFTNVSKFGAREGTAAAELDLLPTDIMKKRSSFASDIIRDISLEKNKEWIEWKGDILITERGTKPGQWLGRNFAYKEVLINKTGDLLGKTIRVKILDAKPSSLIGWPIKTEV